MRALQLVGGALAAGDVHKRNDGAVHLLAFQNGVAGILHGKRRAIAAPEHLGVHPAGQALAEGVEDGAVAVGVRAAVRVAVMGERVHVAPHHLFGRKAQHLCARPVDEHAVAGQVDAEHALARGLQQQPEAVLPEGAGTGRQVQDMGGHGSTQAMDVPSWWDAVLTGAPGAVRPPANIAQ